MYFVALLAGCNFLRHEFYRTMCTEMKSFETCCVFLQKNKREKNRKFDRSKMYLKSLQRTYLHLSPLKDLSDKCRKTPFKMCHEHFQMLCNLQCQSARYSTISGATITSNELRWRPLHFRKEPIAEFKP